MYENKNSHSLITLNYRSFTRTFSILNCTLPSTLCVIGREPIYQSSRRPGRQKKKKNAQTADDTSDTNPKKLKEKLKWLGLSRSIDWIGEEMFHSCRTVLAHRQSRRAQTQGIDKRDSGKHIRDLQSFKAQAFRNLEQITKEAK